MDAGELPPGIFFFFSLLSIFFSRALARSLSNKHTHTHTTPLLLQARPFSDLAIGQVVYGVVYAGARPDLEPPACPPAYAALAKACWAEDLDARPTFPEVLVALRGMLQEALAAARAAAAGAAAPGAGGGEGGGGGGGGGGAPAAAGLGTGAGR